MIDEFLVNEIDEQDEKNIEEIEFSQNFGNLSPEDIEVLLIPQQDRQWRDTERADALRHAEYDVQRSYRRNEETGILEEVPYGECGSQRLDESYVMDHGFAIREVKNYHNAYALGNNIRKQSLNRLSMFGDRTDIVFACEPNFNVGEAERLQELAQKAGSEIEWLYK